MQFENRQTVMSGSDGVRYIEAPPGSRPAGHVGGATAATAGVSNRNLTREKQYFTHYDLESSFDLRSIPPLAFACHSPEESVPMEQLDQCPRLTCSCNKLIWTELSWHNENQISGE